MLDEMAIREQESTTERQRKEGELEDRFKVQIVCVGWWEGGEGVGEGGGGCVGVCLISSKLTRVLIILLCII